MAWWVPRWYLARWFELHEGKSRYLTDTDVEEIREACDPRQKVCMASVVVLACAVSGA